MDNFIFFELFSHIALTLILGWYLMSNLQWYNYKLERVIFKHKKYQWHFLYFLVPIFAYYLAGKFYWIYFYLGLLPALYFWNQKIDKKLVFTPRVKRFFIFLLLATAFQDILCLASDKCQLFGLILPIFAALGASFLYEKILFLGFKKTAMKKLEDMQELQIVAITASYGKTSMKNFLYQIISPYMDTYMTPRSVNTLAGLIKDVNIDMPSSTKIYIAEAGARARGDIDEIAKFLNHDWAIVGKIGEQHIEYFKTLENIRDTKMEILHSKNLKKAFIHKSAMINPTNKEIVFGENITNIQATLEGTSFDLKLNGKIEHFQTPLLGSFHALNLTAVILIAKELGISVENIKKELKNLKQVDHRLQKIVARGKLIIDDSFNGNFEGMSASYDLVNSYNKGNKIVITPGVIESDEKTNIALAKKIDETFDTIIITGTTNAKILYENIHKAKKIRLHDKSKLEAMLIEHTKAGDLVLFSNDAPTFL